MAKLKYDVKYLTHGTEEDLRTELNKLAEHGWEPIAIIEGHKASKSQTVGWLIVSKKIKS